MRKTIFVLLLLCHISLHATDKKAFEWIYNDDKSCSVYLEKTATKDRKIFWSGKCPNKKINGYGILLLTGVKDAKRKKLVLTKGLAHNGVMNGKVFLRFYNKYGTRGSYVIKDDNIKINTTAYFIYPDYNHIVKETFKENSKNKKKAIKKIDNPIEYKKAEKLVYQYENSFKNSLTECENKTHNFKLNLYEYNLDGKPSYNHVLRQLKDTFECQLENKKYKDLIAVTNDLFQTTTYQEKETFEGRYAEIVGISYYHLKDYKNSLNYFLKAKDFSYFKETKNILENTSMQKYAGKEKIKTILNKMISNEIISTTFLLSFSKDKKVIRDTIKKTKQKININSRNSDGETILTKLSYKENPLAIKLLIESGADVNIPTSDGFTLLMNTVYNGDKKGVKFLLDNGANPNTEDKSGYTSLRYALEIKNKDISYKILKQLIKYGGDVNRKYTKLGLKYTSAINYTLLFIITSSTNDPKFIKLLINAGADVNVKYVFKKNDYTTPLKEAIKKNSYSESLNKLLSMLNKNNKKDDIKEPYRYPSAASVKLLKDAGAR